MADDLDDIIRDNNNNLNDQGMTDNTTRGDLSNLDFEDDDMDIGTAA